jgi:hypothetical protein
MIGVWTLVGGAYVEEVIKAIAVLPDHLAAV